MSAEIGLTHAQFAAIHPFLDGNGRICRLLVAFLLCEREILQKPVLYSSHYFRRRRSQYYDLFQAIRDEGDWESWILFFLEGVADVAGEATETARQIVALRESHRRLITENFGRVAGNGLKVLESLYSLPIVTVGKVAAITGVSFTAANQLVNRFAEMRYYQNSPDRHATDVSDTINTSVFLQTGSMMLACIA
ncbi:MAG: Fic family protein [Actinomycetota bacterium]|nr:Fic family protein [Actinomycetota bacterium]